MEKDIRKPSPKTGHSLALQLSANFTKQFDRYDILHITLMVISELRIIEDLIPDTNRVRISGSHMPMYMW